MPDPVRRRPTSSVITIPRVVGAAGGREVQVVADTNDPHRDVRAEAAVVASGAEFEFFGVARRWHRRPDDGDGTRNLGDVLTQSS